MWTQLSYMVETLVEDFGFEYVLQNSDLPEEKVLEILVKGGYIDLTDYFPAEQTNYNDTYKEYGGDNINREEED